MDDTGLGRTEALEWGRGGVRYGRIPEWIIDSDVPDRAKVLYALLATYADRNGSSFPGRRTVAKRLGCGETAYKSAVRDLVRIGALDVEERRRDDGGRASNRFTLHWSPPVEIATGDGREGDRGPDAEATDSRARSLVLPELKETPELEDPSSTALPRDDVEEDSSKPPKLTKLANGHDLAFDALAEVTGTDPSGNRAREVGIALNGSARSGLPLGIRALVANAARARGEPVDAGPEFEIDVAEEIRAKAARYRESMRGSMLTPLALAKWWTDVEKSGAQRDPAAEAFAEAQRLAGEGR